MFWTTRLLRLGDLSAKVVAFNHRRSFAVEVSDIHRSKLFPYAGARFYWHSCFPSTVLAPFTLLQRGDHFVYPQGRCSHGNAQ